MWFLIWFPRLRQREPCSLAFISLEASSSAVFDGFGDGKRRNNQSSWKIPKSRIRLFAVNRCYLNATQPTKLAKIPPRVWQLFLIPLVLFQSLDVFAALSICPIVHPVCKTLLHDWVPEQQLVAFASIFMVRLCLLAAHIIKCLSVVKSAVAPQCVETLASCKPQQTFLSHTQERSKCFRERCVTKLQHNE